MADINFHPDDKVMSGQEVVKNAGFMVAVIMVFEVMFLSATAADGGVVLLVACGIPMGLIGVAVLSQSVMHFLGLGKMVMNEGTMVLRTPRSGKKREKGILAPLERIILAPLSWAVMRDMDKDGDGRLSFKEFLDEMDDVSKSEYLEMQELFEKHDKDHDGYLTPSELKEFIKESGDDNWAEKKEGNWWSGDGN